MKKVISLCYHDIRDEKLLISGFNSTGSNLYTLDAGIFFDQMKLLNRDHVILVDDLNRHPSQLYEAILEGLVLFLIIQYFVKKNLFIKPGLISALFLIFYSLFRFLSEFFRSPDPHIGYLMFDLTLGQLISIIFFFIGLSLFYKKK